MSSSRIFALNRTASGKSLIDFFRAHNLKSARHFSICFQKCQEKDKGLGLNHLPNQTADIIDGMDFSIHGPSTEGVQGGHDFVLDSMMEVHSESGFVQEEPVADEKTAEQVETYNCHENVNLYSCMQTNVPSPCKSDFNHAEHYNMPGSGSRLFDKYIQDVNTENHQSKKFHTSAQYFSGQSADVQSYNYEYTEYEPSPQGIQGDDCVNLKLWSENCRRYDLPHCDEQANSVISGKKTLAQVFKEQENLIQEIARTYRNKQSEPKSAVENMLFNSAPGVQHTDSPQGFQASQDLSNTFTITSPEGIQGDDCVQFKLWLENCNRFGINEKCLEQLDDIKGNRKTLSQVFAEQDALIRNIVKQYQSKRQYSTSAKDKNEVGSETNKSFTSDSDSIHVPPTPNQIHESTEGPPLSQKDRLKRAVKEYGSTVIVFHVGISLVSLGGFYLAVSSGVDMAVLLKYIGISEAVIQSKLTTGASVFVMAYAIHKVFAPVRIGITLFCTPLIVRYLRKIGFLKAPVPKH